MAKKVKRPAGVALVLCIGRDRYKVRAIPSDFHGRAFEIRKPRSGVVYHLTEGDDGQNCDCPGCVYKDKCKHLTAFRSLGLIAPGPRPAARLDVYA
jgi:hypothetical protein